MLVDLDVGPTASRLARFSSEFSSFRPGTRRRRSVARNVAASVPILSPVLLSGRAARDHGNSWKPRSTRAARFGRPPLQAVNGNPNWRYFTFCASAGKSHRCTVSTTALSDRHSRSRDIRHPPMDQRAARRTSLAKRDPGSNRRHCPARSAVPNCQKKTGQI